MIENAIKFSAHEPSLLIDIGFQETADAWTISIRDNGVGFDAKYRHRIFEFFQRLHRADDFSGTGIGLAMVAKAMQRMGGKTWADGWPGNGAEFFLEIPKKNDA